MIKNNKFKYIFSVYLFIIVGLILYGIYEANQLTEYDSIDNPTSLPSQTIFFEDIAGLNEELEEIKQIIDFLKNPEKYQALGAKMPKGALLIGPPGTGKTMIAKAIATESGRAFFHAAGSEFDEQWVGVGASRVRELFRKAKMNAPSIIFIDEIDAIGGWRSDGDRSGRDQTLNQLLVEMDGFDSNGDILVIAATNRLEVLDQALIRAGRFDRHLYIPYPDVKGREEILKVHAQNIKLGPDIDIAQIAKKTPGASGADLANILNEAALEAAKNNHIYVLQADVDEAIDKIIVGIKHDRITFSKKDLATFAYHETGHTIASHILPHAQSATKVTIVSRGMTGGHTQFDDSEHKSLWKAQLLDQLTVLLAGRAAEELFMGDVTNGASNDMERATQLAHAMVSRWGMSDKVGLVVHDKSNTVIEKEVQILLDHAYERAKKILLSKKEQVHTMAKRLLEQESLNEKEIREILSKNKLTS